MLIKFVNGTYFSFFFTTVKISAAFGVGDIIIKILGSVNKNLWFFSYFFSVSPPSTLSFEAFVSWIHSIKQFFLAFHSSYRHAHNKRAHHKCLHFLEIFYLSCPVAWDITICQLHFCREGNPFPMRPPVYCGWWPMMSEDGILVVEGFKSQG